MKKAFSIQYQVVGGDCGTSSLLKNPPGEGTGPTRCLVFNGIPVGRVPSRGAPKVFQEAARDRTTGPQDYGLRTTIYTRAFSLIEILVAMALMSFIVLGLLAMFHQTSKVFRSGIAQVDIMAGGRAVMDTIMRELDQMSPCAVGNTVNFFAESSSSFSSPLVQPLPPGSGAKRTNVIQTLFFLNRYNQDWTAIGYQVLPINPSAGCVGSLYRYTETTRGNLFQTSVDFRNAAVSNLNLVADGIVHFRVVAFATNGFRVFPNPASTNAAFLDAQALGKVSGIQNTSARWETAVPDQVDCYFLSNAVPAYVELELGILEPAVLERFRSIGDATAQRAYLEQHVAQVHLFRQRIAVRNVDFSAYVYP